MGEGNRSQSEPPLECVRPFTKMIKERQEEILAEERQGQNGRSPNPSHLECGVIEARRLGIDQVMCKATRTQL